MVRKPSHVALLRGINVGGKNRLPMDELRAMFVDCGCDEVTTYIQSGNVVFRAPRALAARVPTSVSRPLAERLGRSIPVVVRSAPEMKRIATGNPFLERGIDPATLHVVFLADAPSPSRLAALDPDRSPPDRVAAGRGVLYLQLPNGAARTRFTSAYLDSTLATTTTARNWNTVLALVERM